VSIFARLSARYRHVYDPLLTERRVELAALAFTLSLLMVLIYLSLRLTFLSEPEARLPAAGSLEVASANPGEVVTADMRNQIISRPIFFPSRRPLQAVLAPPVVVDQAAASKNELAKVKLLGVFGGGDTAGVILLVEGKKQRLLIGESVKKWKLKSVDLNEAKFSSGGKQETLVLQYSGAKAASNGGK
jgi:hypothetical protein